MSDKPMSRAQQWSQQLDAAGVNEEEARKVLNSVRDDPRATESDREEFHYALAQQSFIWYVESMRGSALSEEDFELFIKDMRDPPGGEA
jgi:hypothetical protein